MTDIILLRTMDFNLLIFIEDVGFRIIAVITTGGDRSIITTENNGF